MEENHNHIIVKKVSTRGNNLPWPYFEDKKAISSSSLTDILKEIEYQDKQIPRFIILKAAENGKMFHKAIQNFFEKGDEEWKKCFESASKKVKEKIEESIDFFKEKCFKGFLGSEVLYHKFYKENFFATYVDLDFKDFIIELKTNNIIINNSRISILVFRIQLLIQKICTNKEIYLLWSTGNGVFFEKFEDNDKLFEILIILIDILENKDIYSFETKKLIIERIIITYSNSIEKFLIS